MNKYKPMLAKPFEDKWVKFPAYIQPKLDGVRMVWNGKEAYSRTLKPIQGVPLILEELEKSFPGMPLDGELYIHGKSFQSFLGSIRRSKNVDENLDVKYCIYDLPLVNMAWTDRLVLLNDLKINHPRIEIVPTLKATSKEEINLLTLAFEANGYEGSIIRNANGLYKIGKRSSDLLKVKNFQDDEFLIIGHFQLTSKEKIIVPEGTPGASQYSDGSWYKDGAETPEEMLGGFWLKITDTISCKVGSGFTDEERIEYWKNPPINKMATIKYQGFTDDGSLRIPVFKAIRDYE